MTDELTLLHAEIRIMRVALAWIAQRDSGPLETSQIARNALYEAAMIHPRGEFMRQMQQIDDRAATVETRCLPGGA